MQKKSILEKISFKILRNVHNPTFRNILCFFIRFLLPNQSVFKFNETLDLSESTDDLFEKISKDGFSDLGIVINTFRINSIINQLKSYNCFDLESKNNDIINLNQINKETQLGHYLREDLSKIEDIVQIANDSRILNIVSKYFKSKPTISNINCWWSFANKKEAKEAQFFHRDIDDYKFVKLFIYLTDVSEENGPHLFVKGSHKSNKLNKLKRFSDTEVEANFNKENILILNKSKGSGFLEDTYGIHKGQLPITSDRLILQVQYSYLPIRVENYNPIESNLLEKLNLDTYVNRLILKKNK